MRLVEEFNEDTGQRFTYDADRLELLYASEKFLKSIQPYVRGNDDPRWWVEHVSNRAAEKPEVLEFVRAQLEAAKEEQNYGGAHETVRIALDRISWGIIDELRMNDPRPGQP